MINIIIIIKIENFLSNCDQLTHHQYRSKFSYTICSLSIIWVYKFCLHKIILFKSVVLQARPNPKVGKGLDTAFTSGCSWHSVCCAPIK